jgi:ABC-type transporter Mla subunit MlaD
MKLEWDAKIGPASIIGLIGSLTILVSLGVVWGTTTAKIDNTGATVQELKQVVSKSNDGRELLVNDLRNIATLMQTTVGELKDHEATDRDLRQADLAARQSFERRLITIERINPRNGMALPPPGEPPPEFRFGSRAN